jgi:excisionase family DNA binding protein
MNSVMKAEIYRSIGVLLQSDTTVSAEHRARILTACRAEHDGTKRRFGCVREVALLLAVHRKTVFRYVERGLLHPVRYSARRLRFDMAEVERFAHSGSSEVPENLK